MTIFELDQVEEKLLAHQIADEALEMAAGSKPAANYTLFYCTALDLCPGPENKSKPTLRPWCNCAGPQLLEQISSVPHRYGAVANLHCRSFCCGYPLNLSAP